MCVCVSELLCCTHTMLKHSIVNVRYFNLLAAQTLTRRPRKFSFSFGSAAWVPLPECQVPDHRDEELLVEHLLVQSPLSGSPRPEWGIELMSLSFIKKQTLVFPVPEFSR